MADSHVQVAPDNTGKKVATQQVDRGGGVMVERQEVVVADPATEANVAKVLDAVPASNDMGLVVRTAEPLLDPNDNVATPGATTRPRSCYLLAWNVANGVWKRVQMTIAGLNTVGGVAHDDPDSHTFNPPLKIGARAIDAGDSAPSTKVDAANDAVGAIADRDGATYSRCHPPRIWKVAVDVSASGNNALKAAPGAGLSFYVTDIYLEAASAVAPLLKEDGAGANTTIFPFQSGTKWGHISLRSPLKLAANKSLDLNLGAAVNVRGLVAGFTAE